MVLSFSISCNIRLRTVNVALIHAKIAICYKIMKESAMYLSESLEPYLVCSNVL